MASLHIEHTVDDLDRWLDTFTSFAEVRAKGGVTDVQVRHDPDHPTHVAIDLEFGSLDKARSFLGFLETEIWPNSPHFSVMPTRRLLDTVQSAV
jgi:hypothetical protein